MLSYCVQHPRLQTMGNLLFSASHLSQGKGMRLGSIPQPSSRLVATALAAAVSLLAIVSIATLADGPVLGASTISREDGSQTVEWVMAGGHLFEAGLRPGDVMRPAAAPQGSVAWGAVEVLQGSMAGETVLLTRRWPREFDLLLFALGFEFLAAALVVFLRASDRLAANCFTAFAGTVAAIFVAFPAIGNGHPWALLLEWFGSKGAMAAFVLFFLTTPVERWGTLRRVLLWAPVLVLLFYSYTVLVQPDLYRVAKPLGYSYMAAGLAASMAAMLWPFLTRAPRRHRRLWPVLLSGVVVAAIYLFGSTLPYLLFRRYVIPAEVSIAGVGLLPIAFAWTMLHYPILGMSMGPWAVMKTVFDTISDPIFIVGRDGRLVDASQAGLTILGLKSVREAREPFQQLISPLEASSRAGFGGSLLRRVLSGDTVGDEEHELRLPGGETAYMSVAGTPLFDERGRVEMGVLVYRDISERKRREMAQQDLERQKEEFFANISHDLKTPISAIKASVGVVLANEPPGISEPLHRMLANIDIAADRMASLVEDLLELARLQAGRVELRREICDLRELVLRSAAAIEPLVAARQQKVKLDLTPNPLVAAVDPARLERALSNLLTNAHQHGCLGGTIRLSLRRRAGEALFAVADDGPGIPEAEQRRIFDRFYRAGNSANKGSGLGLPIARAMVELHGGRLWVESRPGTGATFWIAIPINSLSSGGSEVGVDEAPCC